MNEFADHIQTLINGSRSSTSDQDTHYAVKTAWEYMIPTLRRDIEAIQVTLDACGDLNCHPVSESLELLKQDHQKLVKIVEEFSAKWPEPITHILADELEYDSNWMQFMESAQFMQWLPARPLVLINDPEKDGTLLYKDGDIYYKVPNIWYNQPGNRVHKEYPW